MHVAEVFLPVKACLEAAPHNITAATVAQTVRACTAALGAKPYQARKEAADTLRVLAASTAPGAANSADGRREFGARRDGIVSALQVLLLGRCNPSTRCVTGKDRSEGHVQTLHSRIVWEQCGTEAIACSCQCPLYVRFAVKASMNWQSHPVVC